MVIPFETPDIALWATGVLRTAHLGVKVGTEKSDTAGAHRELVISVNYGAMVTEITRQALLTIEAWDVRASSVHDLQGAFNLANSAALTIQTAAGSPLIWAELNAGPNEVRDPLDSGITYSEVVLAVEF